MEPQYDAEHAVPGQQRMHRRNKRLSAKKDSDSPIYNHNGHQVTKGIEPDGESGRKGFHPGHFLKICFRSSCTASKWLNLLWPVVPAAIVVHFVFHTSTERHVHLAIFILNIIAILPAATLLDFAGGELARKLPKVFGVLVDTTLGSVVEIILFLVLIVKADAKHDLIPVIKAAILGSILTNLLFCLGLCFFTGGLRRSEQKFDETVSEVGSGLLLVAGMGLLVPAAFWTALGNEVTDQNTLNELDNKVLHISRITGVLLLVAFAIYMWFQLRTHHSVYDDVLSSDEKRDVDRERDLRKAKLTFTECIIALVIALTCVTMHATFLVLEIHTIVHEYDISDAFMGLILVPLAEKAAEHISAVDEAWDNQINFSLAKILGSTIQTALFNAPLVVMVGWGLHKHMDLNFELFMIIMLILAIIVVGNFLRDGKSNYLEGALLVIVYLIITITTWFYPDPKSSTDTGAHVGAHQAIESLLK
ncbi:MAG: hypothetical protein M1816_004296 [Peltula sp. TS41687]|nr:MAG: hypothetical protein M1816_004296 [Peltula sp. TS41687]